MYNFKIGFKFVKHLYKSTFLAVFNGETSKVILFVK